MKAKTALNLIILTFLCFSTFAQEFYGLKVHKYQELDSSNNSINWMSRENMPEPFDSIYYITEDKSLTYFVENANSAVVDELKVNLSENFNYRHMTPEVCECNSMTPGSRADPDDSCWCIDVFKYYYSGKKETKGSITFNRKKGEISIVFSSNADHL